MLTRFSGTYGDNIFSPIKQKKNNNIMSHAVLIFVITLVAIFIWNTFECYDKVTSLGLKGKVLFWISIFSLFLTDGHLLLIFMTLCYHVGFLKIC